MKLVLSRVSTALAQFIRPIEPSSPRSTVQDRGGQNSGGGSFQKFKAPEGKVAQVIPFPKPDANVKGTPPLPATQPSVAHSFLNLFLTFRETRTHLLRWLGVKAYSASGYGKKKSGKYRKGAMLDQKIE